MQVKSSSSKRSCGNRLRPRLGVSDALRSEPRHHIEATPAPPALYVLRQSPSWTHEPLGLSAVRALVVLQCGQLFLRTVPYHLKLPRAFLTDFGISFPESETPLLQKPHFTEKVSGQ